jgi:bifunctional non-homologous end joining protein LigD
LKKSSTKIPGSSGGERHIRKRSPGAGARSGGSAQSPPEGAGSDLEKYRSKRDPARTNEPFGPERQRSGATRGGRFVVHLHDATRAHYDVRLQIGGTLKSFAVPKGPSLNPEDKRLAVQTEDHPLEYLDFEDVIPEENYGAGAMIAWDIGSVRYLEGTAEEGIARNKIDFELSGIKLRGRFGLIKTSGRPGSQPTKQPQWLLVKKTDAYSSTERDILAELPRSVLSGLTIQELAQKEEVARALEHAVEEAGAPAGEVDATALVPTPAALADVKLVDPSRLYELKLDGVRIIADKHGDAVALRYRNGRAASSAYPEIARAVATLAPERLVLDGEIVAFDERGAPNFQRLQPRIAALRPYDVLLAQAQIPVVFVVFDLLQLGSFDLRVLPLKTRKELLIKTVRGAGLLRALDHLEGDGTPLYELCRAEKLEGLVAKRMDAPYRPGPRRSEDWIKIKCERDEEFVVVGWVTGRRGREAMGALDLATFAGDRLFFRGQVGSGLDDRGIEALLKRLRPLEIDHAPAEGELPRETGVRHFVKPELVVSVRFMGFTDDGRVLRPVFRGARDDVAPGDCRAGPHEQAADELPQAAAAQEPLPASSRVAPPAGKLATRVVISNRNKVFWPEEGYTKGDLCEYYAAISGVMLPFLRGRPIVLVRYPDGIHGKNFYQWRAPPGTPDWIRTLELYDEEKIEDRGGGKSVFLVDDVDGLVHLANLGAIPIHVLARREHDLESCEFLTIDFDVGAQPFKSAVLLALELFDLLDQLELQGFAKTSGQKGLHVLVPLGPGVPIETSKILVELVGMLIVGRRPDLGTMERRVDRRGPKVYVDTGQTGRSRTIVAPYSVRAHPGATVSTPLAREELHVALDPTRFTMMTVPARVAELGDPMAGFFDVRPDVAQAVQKLEEMMRAQSRA